MLCQVRQKAAKGENTPSFGLCSKKEIKIKDPTSIAQNHWQTPLRVQYSDNLWGLKFGGVSNICMNFVFDSSPCPRRLWLIPCERLPFYVKSLIISFTDPRSLCCETWCRGFREARLNPPSEPRVSKPVLSAFTYRFLLWHQCSHNVKMIMFGEEMLDRSVHLSGFDLLWAPWWEAIISAVKFKDKRKWCIYLKKRHYSLCSLVYHSFF